MKFLTFPHLPLSSLQLLAKIQQINLEFPDIRLIMSCVMPAKCSNTYQKCCSKCCIICDVCMWCHFMDTKHCIVKSFGTKTKQQIMYDKANKSDNDITTKFYNVISDFLAFARFGALQIQGSCIGSCSNLAQPHEI